MEKNKANTSASGSAKAANSRKSATTAPRRSAVIGVIGTSANLTLTRTESRILEIQKARNLTDEDYSVCINARG